MQPIITITADGSHSLYSEELDERYHSEHGALQESRHIFIETGLKTVFPEKKEINIFEVGLGTGLNVFLSYLENTNSLHINYTAIEAFPLDIELIKKLNYLKLLNVPQHQPVFEKIHESEWEQYVELGTNFKLKKLYATLQQVELKEQFDLIYFDAFGPRVQPELWTEEIFSKIYAATKSNGFLVTYCAKGEVKRTLKKVGFTVDTLPGPPGKREMVRAVKIG